MNATTTLRQQIDFILERKKIAESIFPIKNGNEIKMYDAILQSLIAIGFEEWKKEVEGEELKK